MLNCHDDAALAAARASAADLPEFSEEALALRFAANHADELRYVAKWGKWLFWDGKRWRADDTIAAFDHARQLCRRASGECKAAGSNTGLPSKLASAKTVAAVASFARADRQLAATIDQWDCDPWLLNTPDGVIDLRTGTCRAARPEDYLTKMTVVSPAGDCPLFMEFLRRITACDESLQGFLQRALGYGLTGSTQEHALFFGYGTGANGKGTLYSTVAGILGDYHRTAPIETFTTRNVDHHPTDLAGLVGARLVTVNETEEGRLWAEARVKQLTGGDPVSARFMRQDFFDYTPQFKLFISGNHKPGLRTVDEAIRRRFHLIPFNVTIPKEQRDATLGEKLKAEWPGILQWMIEGCVAWLKDGLEAPSIVTAATDAYLQSQDLIHHWLAECCEIDSLAEEQSSALYSSWVKWCEANGEKPGSQRKFSEKLETRFARGSGRARRAFDGLRLLPMVSHAY